MRSPSPADAQHEPEPPHRVLDALFAFYRRVLSPVFASSGLGHCRYLPTCSEYAYVAVARHGWLRGTGLAVRRLGRCHPWAAGGLDPVPGTTPARPAPPPCASDSAGDRLP